MRFRTLLATGLLAACGASLPTSDSLVVDVKVGQAVIGELVPFTFANQSEAEVVTGALDCVVRYERREGPRWVPLASFRACIAIAELHPPGSVRGYQTPAPETGGTWRLVVEAWTGSGPERDRVTARSQAFEVVEEESP